MLYREPKLLKEMKTDRQRVNLNQVSVLYREPKLLKDVRVDQSDRRSGQFQCSTVSRNC